MNYYNEFDPKAAEWLRELIAENLIPAGDVDERSITDVNATDLLGYTQCHFFAGIGGWSLALRLIGWPDDRPVWTGSCPCQAFSTAGKQRGFDDERDLWPVFANLISQCRPEYVFGEQVENAIKHGWLDRVYADLEAQNYAIGAHILGAHSVGAPHQRQRLYWGAARIADTTGDGHIAADGLRKTTESPVTSGAQRIREFARGGDNHGVDDTEGIGRRICNAAHIGKTDGEIDAFANASCGGDCVAHMQGDGRDERGPESDGRSASAGCGNIGIPDAPGERCGEARSTGERSEKRIADGGTICGVDDPEILGRGICNAAHIGKTDGEINALANAGDCGRGMADTGLLGSTVDEKHTTRNGECCTIIGVANGNGERQQEQCIGISVAEDEQRETTKIGAELRSIYGLSPWLNSRYVYCRDDKVRRVPAESILFRVADGVSESVDGGGVWSVSEGGGFPLTTKKEGRAMLLKGYGNAIVPELAAVFVEEFMGSLP